MPTRVLTALVLLPMLVAGVPAAAEGFFASVKVGDRFNVVVDEPDFEARSTGSIAVRVYNLDNIQPGDETTFYVGGMLVSRDGAVERIEAVDLDADGVDEVVVTVRSAGSGGYLSAYGVAVSFDGTPAPVAFVEGLAADADLLAQLRASMP